MICRRQVLHNVYTLTAQQYSKGVDPGAPGARSTAAVLLTDIHSTAAVLVLTDIHSRHVCAVKLSPSNVCALHSHR